ncbi:MAG: metal ABC transporter permease [Candidatus Krumholzibacteria bacterium]|jgi:zinc/manganese transport system permease protein|nr:metal ABC transporter permease [Candidatus Krumholzibacteria bacterium]MDP6669846.1 metal ABC transporter permease [Candidatus Krumholzibacteria bacterium]MDP6796851.1 metal ABC transporter permease [Candidatus Krumholzibacteria bacterium]MDP7022270.1 metal ABC transporter permease [Candidatus Krumholzibacteria bacterium]
MDVLVLMAAPFVASVILVLIHAYLGGHVLRRGVIFVDLAMAQFAAMGVAFGLLFGFELESMPSYYLGLLSALVAAGLFSLSRHNIRRVPQEAIIGIAYVASAAAAILIADRAPHGAEHIKQILVGSILWVSWQEVLKTALLYGALGLLLLWAHPRLKLVSENPEGATKKGLRVLGWDVLFYSVFALVVTSSVRIAGVLLVFSILIVPSVFAALLGVKEGMRLPLAWGFGIVMSFLGMLLSYFLDFPTGASVVVVFALGLFPVLLLKKR